jgi:hypothetical protein
MDCCMSLRETGSGVVLLAIEDCKTSIDQQNGVYKPRRHVIVAIIFFYLDA